MLLSKSYNTYLCTLVFAGGGVSAPAAGTNVEAGGLQDPGASSNATVSIRVGALDVVPPWNQVAAAAHLQLCTAVSYRLRHTTSNQQYNNALRFNRQVMLLVVC